jgi:hypothetical protein
VLALSTACDCNRVRVLNGQAARAIAHRLDGRAQRLIRSSLVCDFNTARALREHTTTRFDRCDSVAHTELKNNEKRKTKNEKRKKKLNAETQHCKRDSVCVIFDQEQALLSHWEGLSVPAERSAKNENENQEKLT